MGQLTTIAQKVFKQRELVLEKSDSAKSVDNWNSLNNTLLFYEVEPSRLEKVEGDDALATGRPIRFPYE